MLSASAIAILPHMLDSAKVDEEVTAYRLKLSALLHRFARGERATIEVEAMNCGDALVCLMEEARSNSEKPSTT